ncbi:MAG: GFA family protein [Planctomycetes bacterium]|nr:GFA family protein [Planctomycetota bacterium]
MCHCLDCQRRTGSIFGAQAWFPTSVVTVDGQSSEYCRIADSGNRISYYFCPSCASTVYYRAEAFSDWTAVPVGAFADPSFPAPRVSVYESRKHSWLEVPTDIEHID